MSKEEKLFTKSIARLAKSGYSAKDLINDKTTLKILQDIMLNPEVNPDEYAKLFVPKYDHGLCYADLSKCDLSKVPIELLYRISFSTMTKWPPQDKLPKGFYPDKIIEKAKTFKGLGVEKLHEHGITGKGVTIAYIDWPFDVEHVEFKGQNIEYVSMCEDEYNFHGYSVAGLLMGKNIGIAKDIKLLYYATGYYPKTGKDPVEYAIVSKLKSLQDIIKRLKNNEDISAVGMSSSIRYIITYFLKDKEKQKYYLNIFNKMKQKLEDFNVPLIDTSILVNGSGFIYSFKIDPTLSNDDLDNYFSLEKPSANENKMVSVIDADKCLPLAYTKDGYKYENFVGSGSWCMPQIVGLYALSKQVDKEISFEEFTQIAHNTAQKPNSHGVRMIDSVKMVKEVQYQKEIRDEQAQSASSEK